MQGRRQTSILLIGRQVMLRSVMYLCPFYLISYYIIRVRGTLVLFQVVTP